MVKAFRYTELNLNVPTYLTKSYNFPPRFRIPYYDGFIHPGRNEVIFADGYGFYTFIVPEKIMENFRYFRIA